jgi:hypothetical protein
MVVAVVVVVPNSSSNNNPLGTAQFGCQFIPCAITECCIYKI